MARRTISVGLIHDIERYVERHSDGQPPVLFRPHLNECISYLRDGSPYERLLWIEIRHIEKVCRFTTWQKWVFECYLRGLSLEETALVCDKSKSMIQQHLDAAFKKAETQRNRGLLTVTIEQLGWASVKEALAEKLELRLKRRQKKRAG